MALAFSMLKNVLHTKMQTHATCHLYAQNIFPLHTKTQNYPLSVPMCYSKYRNVDLFALKEVMYID